MRIGILTLPLGENYGATLQAFATQKILKKLGHQPLTFAIEQVERRGVLWRMTVRPAWRIFKKLFVKPLQKPDVCDVVRNQEIRKVATRDTARFVRENISQAEKSTAQYKFDAFIVGSDQVWRREFMRYPWAMYFLDFYLRRKTAKRIAFSASFGTDSWTFSPEETKKFSALAKKFQAISVREDSGVELCRKYLGVDAEHLVDPTMALEKSDYEKIIEDDETRGFLELRGKVSSQVFSFILDESAKKSYVERVVSETLGAKIERFLPTMEELALGAPLQPVSAWLRGFRDAEFVVTDSFHGSVFSIIFNKPFLSIGNAERGMARFESLLKMFGLENRLLLLPENPSDDLKRQILDIVHAVPNWQEVNARLARERLRAKEFLENALAC